MIMQYLKDISSKKNRLLHIIGLGFFFISSSTYAVFESLEQRKYNANRLLTTLSIKYNQYFEEIPAYRNKECAIESNLIKLGYDLYFIQEITCQNLQADINSLYSAASSLKPWNPFAEMDYDTQMLYNDVIYCAHKAEQVINPLVQNFTFVKGCQIYRSYYGLPLNSYEMASWIYSRSQGTRDSLLLTYEESVLKDIRFIDSFTSANCAAYPYLYDKLRSLRYEILSSVSRLKVSYDYQQALYYKRLEEERVAAIQKAEREREYRAEVERQLVDIQRERYALELVIQDLQWQQLYQELPYFELHYVPVVTQYLTIDQIIAENRRLQEEIDRMVILHELNRYFDDYRW